MWSKTNRAPENCLGIYSPSHPSFSPSAKESGSFDPGFYPPTSSVKFEEQKIEKETLTESERNSVSVMGFGR